MNGAVSAQAAAERPLPTSAVDFAIVGAGPAGIAAACVAAEHGLDVAVIDQGELAGGQIWRGHAPGEPGATWRRRFLQSNAAFYNRAAVVDLIAESEYVTLTVERAPPAIALRRILRGFRTQPGEIHGRAERRKDLKCFLPE